MESGNVTNFFSEDIEELKQLKHEINEKVEKLQQTMDIVVEMLRKQNK